MLPACYTSIGVVVDVCLCVYVYIYMSMRACVRAVVLMTNFCSDYFTPFILMCIIPHLSTFTSTDHSLHLALSMPFSTSLNLIQIHATMSSVYNKVGISWSLHLTLTSAPPSLSSSELMCNKNSTGDRTHPCLRPFTTPKD